MNFKLHFIAFDECLVFEKETTDITPRTPRCSDKQECLETATSVIECDCEAKQVRGHKDEFEPYEDFILTQIVEGYGQHKINWLSVTAELNTKAGGAKIISEVYERWNRVLNPEYKKGAWSIEEDAKLIALLVDNKIVTYAKLARLIGRRTGSEVRRRVEMKIDEWVEEGIVPEGTLSEFE